MRNILLATLSDMVSEVLFGEKNLKKVDGMNIPMAIEKIFDYITIAIFKHPLNALTGGLLGKYKLIEPIKKSFEIGEKVKDAIEEEVGQREKLSDQELGSNILEECIKHNRSCSLEEKLSLEDITQACMIFKLAAVDTSRNTTEFMLNHFVNNTETLNWFKANILDKLEG